MLQEDRCGGKSMPVSGKPTTAPFLPSPETASPLSCLVKKLEQEPKSSCVQASGLFTMHSWGHFIWDAFSAR